MLSYKDKYKKFSIIGIYEALVVDVYDGDSITVVFDPFPDSKYSDNYWFKIRLAGIDTPEIKLPKNYPNREIMKKKAIEVRDLLKSRILEKYITIDILGSDKYGRLLANIYENDELLNEWLISIGYAQSYNGGTKSKWLD